ncbi:hypothetical protein AB5J52_14005 [Streptomyces sp. R39]|uniref:Peptidase M41 domain-containing protein n=1 Tax=Streptomyces sp. R39 TaxID=3238631 RepID=A0AB39QQU3_9ACTN
MNDQLRIALHEAGHTFIAWRFGQTSGPVTVVPGPRWAGTAHHDRQPVPQAVLAAVNVEMPYLSWPAAVRHDVDVQALITAAGHVAEETLGHRIGRRGDPLAIRAAELAAARPLTEPEERRILAGREDTTGQTDDERLAALMLLAHGHDPVTGSAWLNYITATARTCITRDADRVLRLAAVLADHGTLSGQAVTEILEAA